MKDGKNLRVISKACVILYQTLHRRLGRQYRQLRPVVLIHFPDLFRRVARPCSHIRKPLP